MNAPSARAFIDTNVLVYLFMPVPNKEARARALVERGGVVSAQVLNELAYTLHRKAGLGWPEIEDALGALEALLFVVPVTADTARRARVIASRHGFSLWDACIWAAAVEAGADTLWSEDMHPGQTIDGVALANPFA